MLILSKNRNGKKERINLLVRWCLPWVVTLSLSKCCRSIEVQARNLIFRGLIDTLFIFFARPKKTNQKKRLLFRGIFASQNRLENSASPCSWISELFCDYSAEKGFILSLHNTFITDTNYSRHTCHSEMSHRIVTLSLSKCKWVISFRFFVSLRSLWMTLGKT